MDPRWLGTGGENVTTYDQTDVSRDLETTSSSETSMTKTTYRYANIITHEVNRDLKRTALS